MPRASRVQYRRAVELRRSPFFLRLAALSARYAIRNVANRSAGRSNEQSRGPGLDFQQETGVFSGPRFRNCFSANFLAQTRSLRETAEKSPRKLPRGTSNQCRPLFPSAFWFQRSCERGEALLFTAQPGRAEFFAIPLGGPAVLEKKTRRGDLEERSKVHRKRIKHARTAADEKVRGNLQTAPKVRSPRPCCREFFPGPVFLSLPVPTSSERAAKTLRAEARAGTMLASLLLLSLALHSVDIDFRCSGIPRREPVPCCASWATRWQCAERMIDSEGVGEGSARPLCETLQSMGIRKRS